MQNVQTKDRRELIATKRLSRVHRYYCTRLDCLTKTCSRHKCHLSKRKRIYDWQDFGDDCGMYKSKDRWETFYMPPIDEWESFIEVEEPDGIITEETEESN